MFTGAGVSAESGIPTFRDALEGLWARFEPERLATEAGFRADPALVWRWYAERRERVARAEPNAAHRAIAASAHAGRAVTVVTQNVDGLHQRAGSRDVVELHGSIVRAKCLEGCGPAPTGWERDARVPPPCPACGAPLRPDVVWFGEMLPAGAFELAQRLAGEADAMLVVGTSGLVQPAASLPWAAVRHRRPVVVVDPNPTDLDALAAADALSALAGHRREQVWAASGAKAYASLFKPVAPPDDPLQPQLIPAPTLAQDVVGDYAATGLSLRAHPLSFLRTRLSALKLSTAQQLASYPSGRLARACGIVTVRQQPGTAKGVVFLTLEDETGTVNVIVWKAVKEAQRSELMRARLLAVYGVWQRDDETGGQVRHLVAKRLKDLTPWLGELDTSSRDFH